MQFCTLGLIFLLSSSFAFAQGRAPAVEDFVGIEVEHPEQTPPGTEALFNFEKDMYRYEESQESEKNQKTNSQELTQKQNGSATNWPGTFALAFALGLPLVSWVLIMSHLRRKATEASVPNIRVFEDYKRERLARKTAEEEIKKAS